MSGASIGMDDASRADQAYGMLDKKCKVFLSHGGTKRAFVEQLHRDLSRVHHFGVFFDKDDGSLRKGELFMKRVFDAAKHCELAIVVISPDYLTRKWPMLELAVFVEAQKRRPELKILPIFYKISIKEFKEQQMWFENYWIKMGLVSRDVVDEWKVALKVISITYGLEYDKRNGEVGLRDRIVEVVYKLVNPEVMWDDSHVLGKSRMQEMIEEMIRTSGNGMGEVLTGSTMCIGLFGVGGSGKTTMCKVLCNQMMPHYVGTVCFIELGGLDLLQMRRKLLQVICQLESSLLQTIDEGRALDLLKIFIPRQRVCLVIDNVSDNLSSIEEAATLLNLPFQEGSLIVVASRSAFVFENLGIGREWLMKVPSLTRAEAKALFSHCGRCDTSGLTEEQTKIMESFLERCNFNPLVVKMLGSLLVRIHPSEWKLQLEDVFIQLEYELERHFPHMLPLKTSFEVGGPRYVKSGHEKLEPSDKNLEFNATEWASIGLDGLDASDFSEVGNAAAMEKLKSCLEHGEECVGVVQRIYPHEFNYEQCEYLANKLQMAVRSARLYFDVLRGNLDSFVDVAKVVEVFKFLLALAKQVKSFVQGCCKDSWIQSAMTLTNVWEFVASVGFNLELCRVAFCMERAGIGCLTLEDVEEIHRVEVEVVKKKALSDEDALSLNIMLEGHFLSNEKKDLAFYLLRRLNQVKPIPGATLQLSESSTSYDGGWFQRLFEWVKPCEQLGRGASGTVHKAMLFGKPVAKRTFLGTHEPVFTAEVEALSPLSHPNVMSIFCSGKDRRGCCSIVMELMDEDLQKLMERRLEEKSSPSDDNCPSPFPILEAVDIMLQIGEGGKYLHDQGIIHRDLKSMNILAKNLSGEDLDGYVHVKVADFGLSKTKERSIGYSTTSYNVGTSRWMAPEIVGFYGSDEGSSSRIEGPKHPFERDIYSFGMVCFEILTGHVPFSSVEYDGEVKRQVIQGRRPELPKDPQKCPPLLKELIERCWSSNPEERPTFIAICSALKYLKYLLMRSCETIQEAEQSRSVPSVGTSGLDFGARAAEMSTLASEAVKPKLIGDNVVIDLTADLLGVSSTGYVIKTKFTGKHGLSVPCVLKRTSVVNQAPPDLARLKHEHVVHLIDYWIEEKDMFLVMEVMHGDLAKLIARTKNTALSPFSLHVAVDLMMQIGQAMLFLHKAGVSHPHLKCENVLYSATGQPGAYRVGDVVVKLGGFRCPRPADLESKNRDVLCFGLTCLEILTGDLRQRSIVLARPSIPENVPAILKHCIVSCLETHPKSSDVVWMLSRAKSHIIQHCKDEHLCVGESMEIDPTEAKMDSDREEAFAVHELHPESNNIVSTSARSTFVFFHGFHKGPEEWRRTWMTRDNKLVWPQEWLPEDLGAGNIRVLSVSFDADSTLSNNYNRYEISKILVQRLVLRWNLGYDNEALFLIGHSFGGVLIKSLVTEAQYVVQNSVDQREAVMCEKFLKRLARIVFYSVPLEFESYISECKKIVALQRSSFLQSFQKDTRFVADMNKLSTDFERAVPENVKILAFLEGKPMSKRYILVTEESYEGLSLGWERHKIDKDNHFEVCRPNSKSHSGYKILLDHLRQDMEAVLLVDVN